MLGPLMLLLAGCGATTATVEPAAPLSPAETERLIEGVRAAWSSGGEVAPAEIGPAEAAPGQPQPGSNNPGD